MTEYREEYFLLVPGELRQGLRHEMGDETDGPRRADMAHGLTDAQDRTQQLEHLDELKSKVLRRLKDKHFDLESRSRRQNLGFIGIPVSSRVRLFLGFRVSKNPKAKKGSAGKTRHQLVILQCP